MKHTEPLRLATRHNGRRDGELVLVDASLHGMRGNGKVPTPTRQST